MRYTKVSQVIDSDSTQPISGTKTFLFRSGDKDYSKYKLIVQALDSNSDENGYGLLCFDSSGKYKGVHGYAESRNIGIYIYNSIAGKWLGISDDGILHFCNEPILYKGNYKSYLTDYVTKSELAAMSIEEFQNLKNDIENKNEI